MTGPNDEWQWRAEPVEPGRAVIFDMDGVLSDANKRQHFLEGHRRDWTAFFEACGEDALIEETGRLLEVIDDDLTIVLLTARPIDVLPQTVAWLSRYELRWDLLVMRPARSFVSSPVFKRQAVHELRAEGYELLLAFDDDRRNYEMFHAEGVPCVYIHSGYYD